jgi:hypothetical protein
VHPRFGHQRGEAGDVATQSLDFLALMGSGGYPSMKREAGMLCEPLIPGRRARRRCDRLQRERLAPLFRPHRDAVADRVPDHRGQAIVLSRSGAEMEVVVQVQRTAEALDERGERGDSSLDSGELSELSPKPRLAVQPGCGFARPARLPFNDMRYKMP